MIGMLTTLPGLFKLFDTGKVIKLLPELLKLATGKNPNAATLKAFEAQLNEQAGRSGGKSLGRAVCEQIDAVLENDESGLTPDQRLELAKGLASNGALQLTEAAELLLAYPALQAAVVRAKQPGNPAELKTARDARNTGAAAVKGALVDVGRVVAGDKPLGTP